MADQYIRYPATSSGNGIQTYASVGNLPISAADGAAAITLDTDALYIFNLGLATWYEVASPSSVLSIGTIDTGSPSADGAHITANALILQSASATAPGLVNTGTQTFAGAKTFTGAISASNLSGTNTGDITLAAVGAVPNANGASLSGQALTLQPASSTLPGVVTAGAQSFGGAKTFVSTIAASNFSGTSSGTNTGDVTIGTANGLSLSGQALSLQLATGSVPGALSAADWTTFNGKQDAGNYITALTGDATASGPGSAALTLATVNTNVGSFTYASITVNGKGLITAASSGAAPVTTLAAVGSSPNANGASIAANTLTLQPADATNPGVVTAVAQTLAGAKTFSTAPILSSLTASLPLKLDASKNVLAQAIALGGSEVSGQLGIGNGGTGQATKAAAFDALSPMNAIGQLIYGGASGTGTALAAGSSTAILTCNGGAAPSWILPAYYSGYLTAGTDWTLTSATYTDFANGASIVLANLVSVNMGTAAAAGSSLPGVTLTLPTTAYYEVTATVNFFEAAAADASFRIVDGTGTVIAQGVSTRAVANYQNCTLVGIYSGTAGATTFKLQGATSTSTLHITNGAASGTPAVSFTVKLLR